MISLMNDLFAFFGITTNPICFADFIPWFFKVLISLGIFLYLFGMIKSVMSLMLRYDRW